MSASVSGRPATRETVCAPLAYEPPAMPIFTTPWEIETSLKSGFELGKLPPIRTVWGLPLTEIVALVAPASVRDAVSCGMLPALDPPLPLVDDVVMLVEDGADPSPASPSGRGGHLLDDGSCRRSR